MTEELTRLVLQRGDDTAGCYVCGHANPIGMRVRFVRDGEQGSRAQYVSRIEHDGWPGVLHGGVTFALMDEAVAYALFFQGIRGVTARVETSFKRPIRTGTALLVRAWMLDRKRKLITAKAEVRTDDEQSDLLADMNATMFLLAEDKPSGAGEND